LIEFVQSTVLYYFTKTTKVDAIQVGEKFSKGDVIRRIRIVLMG